MNFCSATLLDLFSCKSCVEKASLWIMLRTLADAFGDAGLSGSSYGMILGKQALVM